MKFSLEKPIPTRKEFLLNIEKKKTDKEFLGDTVALLSPDEKYSQEETFKIVVNQLIQLM